MTTLERSYALSCVVDDDFAAAKTRVVDALTAAGFGVLTEIDMQEKLHAKLGVAMDAYVILGACHPASAHKAVQAEPMIGLLLPCNVIVYRADGKTVVAAINPMTAMQMVNNDVVAEVARDITQRLRAVIASLQEIDNK